MEWTDEGVVLGSRRHGEGNVILEVMTRDHGRHLGLVRGGAGSRLRAVLQPGNSVRVAWRARIARPRISLTLHPGYARWLAVPPNETPAATRADIPA